MMRIAPGSQPSVIDVEASGFGPDSYPIEVGLALSNGEKYCSLIAPPENWVHWDDGAAQVHHITREILREHGKPVHVVAADLNDILGRETVFSDGWVVDHPWINKLFMAGRTDPQFTTSSLEMILSEAQMEIWHETKDRVIADMSIVRHRASNDAFVIQQTWVETRDATS